MMFHSFIPTPHRSYPSAPDGLLFGALAKTVFSTMLHIISLRHFYLLAKHAMALGTVILGNLFVGPSILEDTSPCLLLPQDYNRSVAVIMIGRSIIFNIIDGLLPFSYYL